MIILPLGSEKIGSEGLTATYKALWRLDETKKLVVAFKTLQKEKSNDCLKVKDLEIYNAYSNTISLFLIICSLRRKK